MPNDNLIIAWCLVWHAFQTPDRLVPQVVPVGLVICDRSFQHAGLTPQEKHWKPDVELLFSSGKPEPPSSHHNSRRSLVNFATRQNRIGANTAVKKWCDRVSSLPFFMNPYSASPHPLEERLPGPKEMSQFFNEPYAIIVIAGGECAPGIFVLRSILLIGTNPDPM